MTTSLVALVAMAVTPCAEAQVDCGPRAWGRPLGESDCTCNPGFVRVVSEGSPTCARAPTPAPLPSQPAVERLRPTAPPPRVVGPRRTAPVHPVVGAPARVGTPSTTDLDMRTRMAIRQAIADYQDLEIDRAIERLQAARRGCAHHRCSPMMTARVYMSLGVVAVGGQQDNVAGIDFMTQALWLDPAQEPDVLLLTPEITAAFNRARARVRGRSADAARTEIVFRTMALNLSNLPPGTLLGGANGERYRVQKKLGEGGMGAVYLARDELYGECALKVLHDWLVLDAQARASFEQEAKVPGRFEGDALDFVVKVFDAGICPKTSAPFMVMEKLNGEELGARIERLGRLPPAEVLLVAEKLSVVLDEAARLNLVHRDLKPENLFFARVGGHPIPKVMDFGLAKVIQAGSVGKSRMIGTPVYMAPEQFEAKGMSPLTDIWAMGLIVFTALTGMIFWRHTDNEYQVMCEVLMLALPRARASARAAQGGVSLSAAFDDWFARCTDNDPTRRFQTAGEAFRALEPALQALARSAAPGDSQPPSAPPEKRPMAATEASGEGLDERVAAKGPLPFTELVETLEQLTLALNEVPEDQARKSLSSTAVRFHPKGGREVMLGDLRPRETVQRVNGKNTTQATTTRMNTAELAAHPVEFIIGQPITPRGDVWSIGTIAFHAITGGQLWRSEVPGALLKEILSAAKPVASVRAKELGREGALPPGFDAWLARCIENTPQARWKDPATAVMRLRALVPVAPTTPIPALPPVRALPPPTNRLWWAVGLAVGGIALALLGWKRVAVRSVPEPTLEARVARSNPWRAVQAVPELLMQDHEITRGEFALGQSGALGAVSNPSLPRADVTWEDAARFCVALRGQLPTLTQWRSALRTMDWSGDLRFPHALHVRGTLLGDVSPDGIADLHGNVGEWTLDAVEGGHVWAGALYSDTDTGRIYDRLSTGSVTGPGARVGFRCVRGVAR